MERSRPPTIRTSPTPCERSSSGRTILSAISVSSRRGRSPESAMVTTGAWSLSILAITGGFTSRGRLRWAIETLSRTSWAATSMLRLSTKVVITSALPGLEIERSSCTPWIVLICSSSFWVTCVSISSVEAPGSSTRTVTVGRSTAGKRSTPSRKYEAAPTTTSAITIMVANTGRLMQTSASFCTRGLPLGVDGLAGREVARLQHDALAGLEPGHDLDAVVGAPAGLHAHLDDLALAHHEQLLDARKRHQRGGGHANDGLRAVGDDLRAGERARLQHRVLVRHLRLDQQRAVLLLHDRAQAHDAAVVDGGVALDGEAHRVARAHAGRLALGHGQAQPQRMRAHQRGHRRAGRQV